MTVVLRVRMCYYIGLCQSLVATTSFESFEDDMTIHTVSQKTRQIWGAVVSSDMVQLLLIFGMHNQHTLENDEHVN